jgi:hypothetical protein
VRIDRGSCSVEPGFADRADVRYTADAKVWCAMALGMVDARELLRKALMTKDGSAEAMDQYFYQISRPVPTAPELAAELMSESNESKTPGLNGPERRGFHPPEIEGEGS